MCSRGPTRPRWPPFLPPWSAKPPPACQAPRLRRSCRARSSGWCSFRPMSHSETSEAPAVAREAAATAAAAREVAGRLTAATRAAMRVAAGSTAQTGSVEVAREAAAATAAAAKWSARAAARSALAPAWVMDGPLANGRARLRPYLQRMSTAWVESRSPPPQAQPLWPGAWALLPRRMSKARRRRRLGRPRSDRRTA